MGTMAASIPTLTVEPIAGLGNRLRVVGSALALARATGAGLRLVWTRTPDLHCRFEALFEPLPGVEVFERSRTWSRIVRRVGHRLNPPGRILYQRDIERFMAARADFRALLRENSLFIVTCSRFFDAPGLLAPLVPTPEIRREVDAFCSRFDGHTTGVHIRRTDSDFKHRSPTTGFLERMQAEIAADPLARFFLATDDPAEEARLRAAFGDRILARPRQLDRARPEGIRDALVDLLCLARTRRVIAGVYSSFSEAAAEIGGVERVVIDCPEGGMGERSQRPD